MLNILAVIIIRDVFNRSVQSSLLKLALRINGDDVSGVAMVAPDLCICEESGPSREKSFVIHVVCPFLCVQFFFFCSYHGWLMLLNHFSWMIAHWCTTYNVPCVFVGSMWKEWGWGGMHILFQKHFVKHVKDKWILSRTWGEFNVGEVWFNSIQNGLGRAFTLGHKNGKTIVKSKINGNVDIELWEQSNNNII